MSDQVKTSYTSVAAREVPTGGKHLLFLDVRSRLEFETEKIANAINIPLEELDTRLEEISRQKELIVVCRSGKRAERGVDILQRHGFQPKLLAGGMIAWRKAGRSIEEGRKRVSVERQIQLIVGSGVLAGVILGTFVSHWFLLIPGFFGAGLTFSGLSGTCTLGMLLTKAPWNKLGPSTPETKANTSCEF